MGRLAGDQLKQRRSDTVQIGATVDGVAVRNLFRRSECERSDHMSDGGQSHIGNGLFLVKHQAEVEQFCGAVTCQHDVRWLDIAVDQTGLMDGR